MYDTILISLDGSLAAEAILWEVEKLLSIHPAKIILLLVISQSDLRQAVLENETRITKTANFLDKDAALLIHSSEDEREYLLAIARRLKKSGAETISVVGFRDPVDEIASQAHSWNVQLIAMTTHGRSGFERLFQGSVTESVLHCTNCPMLIVRVPQKPLPRFASTAPNAALSVDGITENDNIG